MDSIINYLTAVRIEQLYFISLVFCLLLNFRIKKVFVLALIVIAFNSVSHLFLFNFLLSRGINYWVLGWSAYELLLIICILLVRVKVHKSETKFILSDILLMVGSLVQILVYGLTYLAKSLGFSVMDIIYAATAPTLYALTIFVLLFPSIYRMVGLFKGYREFKSVNINSRSGNDSSRGIFNAKCRSRILGN